MPFERWLHVFTLRVRALFRGRALDDDLDEELKWHFEHLVDANIERGMSPEAARRAALIAMGGVQQRKEECRVLVAAGTDRPLESPAAFYDESFHRGGFYPRSGGKGEKANGNWQK